MNFDWDPALNAADPGSRHEPIVDWIRARVNSGLLQPGQPVPSVRDLAQLISASPIAVSKAYAVLEREGLLKRRGGLPMTVADQVSSQEDGKPRLLGLQLELMRPILAQAVQQARALDLPDGDVLRLFESMLRNSGGPQISWFPVPER